jgi:protocatechuate 3,4-dioxygenase beta subunit
MKKICIITITLVLLFSSITVNRVVGSQPPEHQNQGQLFSSIHPGTINILSAQGKDDVALTTAWLATNESGVWKNITGKYGSPMNIGGVGNQWVWTNFTWQNTSLVLSKVIGWRIIYQDSEVNTIQTPIMSFSITNNAPTRPILPPQGPRTGNTGEPYEFVVCTADPDNDNIAYLIDWGDGNQSGWTAFVPSITEVTVSHSWASEDTYSIKVKAKDIYGAESSWSSSALITIIEVVYPPLMITTPASVMEGASFPVTITALGDPVNHALVSFQETTLFTNATGMVAFIAPQVQSTRLIALSAQHTGYQSIATTIMVIDVEELEEEKGWIYGWVANTSGAYLEDARVCLFLSEEQTTMRCAFTDDQGRYTFQVSPGTYTVEASKYGYETATQTDVEVLQNHAVETNIFLQRIMVENPVPPANENRDLIEAVIDAGIANEKISGELDVTLAAEQYNLTLYNEALSAAVAIMNQSEVTIQVSATDLPGTILAVRLYGQENLSDIAVTMDGESIPQVGFSEIFEMDDTTAVYARVIDTTGEDTITYCLVYLPHFSDHEISIKTILHQIEVFGGILAIITFIVVAGIAGFILLVPIISIERKQEQE